MAPEINDNEKCRAVLRSTLEALNKEIVDGASPVDIAHALTFILCMYKYKFGWTTEQLLQLYELYVMKMEEQLNGPPDPIAEA